MVARESEGLMEYPKSRASLDRLLKMMANYVGDEWADQHTSKSIDELHDRMEKGCLAIKIAHDMDALNNN